MFSQMSVFLILLFLAVFFISQALIMPAAGRQAKHKELTKRLNESRAKLDAETQSLLNEHYLKGMSPLEQSLVNIELLAGFKKQLELAGIKTRFTQVLGLAIFVSFMLTAMAVLFEQAWYVVAVAMFGIWPIGYFIVQKKIADRLQKFEEQLPDALDIMRRVLQAGQPLTQSFYEVGNEMPDPIGPEFKNTFNLLNYGYDLRLAIMQMADRTPTVSMLAFSSAVLLQKETGGNLSENLEKVSKVLRARFKLVRKIRTLSAESRMSSWILLLSPFGLFFVMLFISPEYVSVLYTETRGLNMVSAGMVSLFIGSLWIKKIINIKV